MDVVWTLGHYFDEIIYVIGALILSVVILARVCYFCECMFNNNNGANGVIVLLWLCDLLVMVFAIDLWILLT